ncbi:acyl-CoA dehydrogenase [Tomitella fengzijianii]|uniref:Acyl-CoA dehydrogenase n=2 Tax=Tomitella fengzijianii TaxID=2597660 RepID=A0A516X8W0_9ACTN|nr:acyl-CoA dehydrogenase [Tomitella fengzijianii]
MERDGVPYDEQLWSSLLTTGLIDAVLPSDAGGGDAGMVGLAVILEQQGIRLGRVPLASTGTAALALARFHGADAPLLASLRRGDARIAVATADARSGFVVRRDDGRTVLTGGCPHVHMAGSCTHVLVTADDAGIERCYVVPLDRDGVTADVFDGISRTAHADIVLDRVPVGESDLLGTAADGAAPAAWVRHRYRTAVAAIVSGVCAEAIRRTAQYTSQRTQFGRPLSTNQGVALRAADAYIDTEIVRLTMLDAAWRCDVDSDPEAAVLTAAWWAKEGGVRVVHATQHLHGGMGADVDNHIHRFFLWARELDMVGGPAPLVLDELANTLRTPDPREAVRP